MTRLEELAEALYAAKLEATACVNEEERLGLEHQEAIRRSSRAHGVFLAAREKLADYVFQNGAGKRGPE